VEAGESLPIHIKGASSLQVPVRLYSSSGQLVYSQSFLRDGDYQLPSQLSSGVYVLQALSGGQKATAKIVVK